MLNLDDRLIKEIAPIIKPNALSVLLAISIHSNKNGESFPSNERLMALTGLGRDAVATAISVLIENNLLKTNKKARSTGGKFEQRKITVNTGLISVFVPVKELPFTENPCTVEPSTAEPFTANPPLSINKKEVLINLSIKEGVTPNGEPSPPAFEFQLPSNPSEVETPTSKPKGQENKQEKQRAVSTKVKSKFIPFSESLSSPTAATDFKEFLQTYADGIYKHADAVFYVAKALQWVSNTPAGAKAKYADWRVALAGWCRTDGVKAAPQAQHQQPTPAEIGTAKRNAHLEELQKRGLRRPTPQQ